MGHNGAASWWCLSTPTPQGTLSATSDSADGHNHVQIPVLLTVLSHRLAVNISLIPVANGEVANNTNATKHRLHGMPFDWWSELSSGSLLSDKQAKINLPLSRFAILLLRVVPVLG